MSGHTSTLDKLTRRANQIALFFKSYPHEEAVVGVYSHIEAFWTPKMIREFRAGMHDDPKVDPVVLEAMAPKIEAIDPAERAVMGPGKVGELGEVGELGAVDAG